MMLNSVDLPQPEGPMIDTNSPDATPNETSSTAVIVPSVVTKRLTMLRTSRSGASRPDADAAVASSDGSPVLIDSRARLAPRPAHRRHRRRIAGIDPDVDYGNFTGIDRRDRRLQRRFE